MSIRDNETMRQGDGATRVMPWEMSFNGRTWRDMPGSTVEDQKMNFFFFRRGMLDVEDEVECARREADGIVEMKVTKRVRLKMRSRGLGMGARRGVAAAAESPEMVRERARAKAEEEQVRRWRAGVSLRVAAVGREHGVISLLSRVAGVKTRGVNAFKVKSSWLTVEQVRRLENAGVMLERGDIAVRNRKGRARGEPRQQPPVGFGPLKPWLMKRAAERGVSVSALRMEMCRHPERWPELLRVNKRVVWVRMEGGAA